MAQVVLTELNVYPIKSAAGISLQTAQVDRTGLEGDRRWMVVDLSGKFLTQRQYPRMALIQVQREPDRLLLNAPGMTPLAIPYDLDGAAVLHVQVWRDRCPAVSAGELATAWLSQFLEMPCHLVYMADDGVRPVDPNYAIAGVGDRVSFADAFPFLLIAEASLQDLNDRLEIPIPMNRFRPNLVVAGCDAFAEDTWRQIRIGSVEFHVVKPCARCAIPTVDQRTGIQGKEPLPTLAKYRLREGQIFFGQNLLHAALGTLNVGDPVEILA
jgi:hypothetical protein